MVQYSVLPPELWDTILVYLSANDRVSVISVCRFLHAWRALAWSEITLPISRRFSQQQFEVYMNRLQRLANTLETDPSLPPVVRSIRLQKTDGPGMGTQDRSKPTKRSTPGPQDLDGVLSIILRSTTRLESFMFESPFGLDPGHYFGGMPKAIHQLPLLKTLVLARVHLGAFSRTPISEGYMKSRILEQLIIVYGSRENLGAHIGPQPHLRSLVLDANLVLAPDGAAHWTEVERLSFTLDLASGEGWAEDYNKWTTIVAHGLASGALRKLKMLSIEGPYKLAPLIQLVEALAQFHVPLSSLRFNVKDGACEVLPGFGPVVLRNIFEAIPSLEELCIDQADYFPWPGEWEDYCQAFSHAKRLRNFLAAAMPITIMSVYQVPPLKVHFEYPKAIGFLTEAVRGLVMACPSLHLITFCTFFDSTHIQYAPQTDMERPVAELQGELNGKPIQFWLPPEHLEVAKERYDGHCSRILTGEY